MPMAMRPMDLPDVPRTQAASRLAADCPRGGAPLVLRQNRQTGALLTGCSAAPGRVFAEPHDPRVQTLSTAVVQAVHTLATQVVQGQTEVRREVAAERATPDCTVRKLMALAHPDRRPDTPLAHELTVALVALRATRRPENQVAPPVCP